MNTRFLSLLIITVGFLISQEIDWINKTITVEGSAYGKNKLLAKRGAKTDARRNLIEALKEIRVDSRTIMRDLEVEKDLVVTEASGYIKQAWFDNNSVEYEEVDEKWMCTIAVTMPLVGEYSKTVFPSEKTVKVSKEKAAAKPYTGLVIDLRGKKVVPAMAPKIVTKFGGVLYDMSGVSRRYATEMGLVGYIKKVDNPQSMIRIGDNPLIIKANGTTGETPTDAVVDGDGAELISSLNQKILNECKVAFLID